MGFAWQGAGIESLTRDSLMTLTVHIVFRIFCGFVLGSLGHYSQLSHELLRRLGHSKLVSATFKIVMLE